MYLMLPLDCSSEALALFLKVMLLLLLLLVLLVLLVLLRAHTQPFTHRHMQ